MLQADFPKSQANEPLSASSITYLLNMSKLQCIKTSCNTLVQDIRFQARWLFFVAILGITMCIVISSVGATALIFGKTSIGVFATIASSLSTLPFMHMAKTAHNWLKIASSELVTTKK